MKVRSIAVVLSACWLAACASDGALAPLTPNDASLLTASGNPPPPRVLGTALGTFSTSSPALAAQQTYTFRGEVYYNRNLTTGMNFFEVATGEGSIGANASGVVMAKGTMVLTEGGSGATLSVDLSQLMGYQGTLFVPCPAGSPVNCFALAATFTGTVTPASGPPIQVTGTFKYRWDT